jgi:hypothetical protein
MFVLLFACTCLCTTCRCLCLCAPVCVRAGMGRTSMVATRLRRLLSLLSIADRSGECDPPVPPAAAAAVRARTSRFTSSRSWWMAVLGVCRSQAHTH